MKPKNIGSAFEIRRGEVDRIAAQGAQYFKITGEIEADGVGEAAHTVDFPCLFTDKPSFSFGPELGAGQVVVTGSLPTGSMVVLNWQESVRDDGTVIYSGATFAMVTTGPADQVMVFQWHMEGIGLRNPVPNVDTD